MAKAETSKKVISHAVGRRKSAVARVWLKKGQGAIRVNGEDYKNYFDTLYSRQLATTAFSVVPVMSSYDIQVNVRGGGKDGQAGAVKLAIARAFVSIDETIRPLLRKHGLLTVDSRVKERKKYGQRGARRKFQFVKR